MAISIYFLDSYARFYTVDNSIDNLYHNHHNDLDFCKFIITNMITDMITKIVITITMNFYTRKIETNNTFFFNVCYKNMDGPKYDLTNYKRSRKIGIKYR